MPLPDLDYDGTEGELYDVRDDPHQWRNLWNDPATPSCARTWSPISTTICRSRVVRRCPCEAPA